LLFKKAQLANNEIQEVLKEGDCAALVGDFNFDSSRNYHRDDSPLKNNSIAAFLPEYLLPLSKEVVYFLI
jgi:hypothetical protein